MSTRYEPPITDKLRLEPFIGSVTNALSVLHPIVAERTAHMHAHSTAAARCAPKECPEWGDDNERRYITADCAVANALLMLADQTETNDLSWWANQEIADRLGLSNIGMGYALAEHIQGLQVIR